MSEKIQKRIAFGYNRGFSNKIEVNPIQTMVVKLIFEYYADGLSMRAISFCLASAGIPSPYNNSKWGNQAIANILSYERYVGDDVYPALIDRDLFDRVQALRLSKAK